MDVEVYRIILLSLYVSSISVIIASFFSIPLGIILSVKEFKGKKLLNRIIATFMGLPPVIVGLMVYLMLSRSGPLGKYKLLFTPTAMIIAQIILVSPIIIGIISGGLKNGAKEVVSTVYTLGGNWFDMLVMLMKEYKATILTSFAASFGRAISEVGAVMMVGGNIRGYTRVMTTTIALETGKGNFSLAMAMGMVLLILSFMINAALQFMAKGDS
jgi:tungstate transport system permease protein